MTVFCVNRDLTRDLPARIHVDGFRPKSAVAHSVYAGTIYEKNTEEEPEHIHLNDSTLPVASPDWTYTFRHASVTIIEVSGK
jgi:alpha-L-arabinofuranosidase